MAVNWHSPDWNLIEVCSHDLRQAVDALKPSSEVKTILQFKGGQTCFKDAKDSLQMITNSWLQVLASRVAQELLDLDFIYTMCSEAAFCVCLFFPRCFISCPASVILRQKLNDVSGQNWCWSLLLLRDHTGDTREQALPGSTIAYL